GPGHGWLALQQLKANRANRLIAIDISPHSVEYTRAVLQAAGVDQTRYDIRQVKAEEGLKGLGAFDRIVMAEVIEHLATPQQVLSDALPHAHRDTLFFITTVVNIEAVDHIYLFRELQEVRQLLESCKLTIVDELDLPLKLNLPMPKPAYEVALICRLA